MRGQDTASCNHRRLRYVPGFREERIPGITLTAEETVQFITGG